MVTGRMVEEVERRAVRRYHEGMHPYDAVRESADEVVREEHPRLPDHERKKVIDQLQQKVGEVGGSGSDFDITGGL